MEVKEFAELIADSNVVILDVRKAEEFDEGHIKGAIFIDQFQSDFVELAQAKLPKDKTIAIYCRSGRRSANAAAKLANVGYKCVNLKGGILAWKEADMPVVINHH
jgi:rhodanese-related sulfurtransferase